MANFAASERLDTLLALALAFDGSADGEAPNHASAAQSGARPQLSAALQILSALGEADQQALAQRAAWHAKLERDKQARWLKHTLGRVRVQPTRLDEHVHPSHIAEVLRVEPMRVQTLILRNLPPALAETCAAELTVARLRDDDHQRADGNQRAPVSATFAATDQESPAAVESARHAFVETASEEVSQAPELVALVRRTFLAHFVAASELSETTPLDLLSGIELARLVRLLGVRETALACRGISEAEAIGSLLRRFSAENARAIAAHIATLTDAAPHRVRIADRLVHEAFSLEPEPDAMLDGLGMRLLALACATRDDARITYTAQKLPVAAARMLRELIADGRQRFDRELVRQVAKEAETLAVNLRRNRRHTHKTIASSGNTNLLDNAL